MIPKYQLDDGLQTEPAMQIQFGRRTLTSFVLNLLILLV